MSSFLCFPKVDIIPVNNKRDFSLPFCTRGDRLFAVRNCLVHPFLRFPKPAVLC